MEILHKGELPEDKKWVGNCHKCSSRIRAKQSEIEVSHCQREGSYGSGTCPVCNSLMNFYPEKRESQYGR